MPLEVTIKKPKNFVFETAVCGHGWYDLAPFEWDEDKKTLAAVFQDAKGNRAVRGVISDEANGLRVSLANSKVDHEKIVRDVRHILRIDDEMDDFYAVADTVPGTAWVAGRGAGRLMRSATVFEDMVKTMCTTNCSWGLTKIMVRNLVDKLGASAGRNTKAFPTAKAMAAVDEGFYRSEIKAGYRSPFFVELAERVAGGDLDPESFLHSELPTPELKKEIKNVKGFGDYAADNLLKLLGRYDGLALDSWLRSKFYEKHNRSKTCPDKKIHKHYARFGEWQGLMIWCDMTEYWFEGDGR